MDKLGDWLNSVPLFGIASVSAAVGILYGKGLPSLQWETLIAGCLGLGGGAFAWLATKKQINHQIKVTADNQRAFARRFLQETKAKVDMLKSITSDAIDEDFEVTKAQVEFYLGVLNANALREIPAEIDDGTAQETIQLKQFLDMFTLDIAIYLTRGSFNEGSVKLNTHHQRMIRTIDHHLCELKATIESKLNS